MSGIKLSFYKEINAGALVSSFNLEIPSWGLTLVDCKLFIKDNRKWLGWPSESYMGKDGQKKYKKLAYLDRDRESRLLSAVYKLVEEKLYTTFEQDLKRVREEIDKRNGDRAPPLEEVQDTTKDTDDFEF